MATGMAHLKNAAAACALLLAVGTGLTGCGDDGAVREEPTATSTDSSGQDSPAEAESETESGHTGESPSAGLDGEPLPSDWPSEFLVPDGTVALVIPLGSGYSVLVEGVDSAHAADLIDRMVANGMSTSSGVTQLGNGEWVAEVVGTAHRASYAYAGGGAGLPNVTITLTPAG